MAQTQTIRKNVIKDIEKQVNTFTPFSPIMSKILKVIDNPASSAVDIEKVIRYDQILASRVLRMANSAYYGYGGKISTISQAIVVLGLNTLRALLFTASASRIMNKRLFGYRLREGEFWQYSVLTAIGSRILAEKVKYSNIEEAFIAGLLHDIGMLILDVHVKNNFKLIKEVKEKKSIPWYEAETEILGINHSHVGRRLAESWNFPPILVEVLGYHHNPARASYNQNLTAIICVSAKVGSGLLNSEKEVVFEPTLKEIEGAINILKLSDFVLKELPSQVKVVFKDASTFLNL